jgi:hypothetical protein
MRRILFIVFVLILLPVVAQAYTLVLKDGRRIEVRNQYRIVNELAVFTLPEGNRLSISLEKINVSETELANGDEPGMFVKNATSPPKVSDKSAPTDAAKTDEESPIVASSKPGAKKLTNKDFERYRVRREEMAQDVARRNAAKVGKQEPVEASTESGGKTASNQSNPVSENDKEADILAKRRELEKSKEEYWRGRAKALLTQMRVQEEQIVVLQAQLEENRRTALNNNQSVSVYSSPNYYPYPPVRIGGVPIWMGGGRTTGGGSSTVVINQNPGQQRTMTLQERLTDLQLQYQETLIRYDELLEEGRRAGALPGWLR